MGPFGRACCLPRQHAGSRVGAVRDRAPDTSDADARPSERRRSAAAPAPPTQRATTFAGSGGGWGAAGGRRPRATTAGRAAPAAARRSAARAAAERRGSARRTSAAVPPPSAAATARRRQCQCRRLDRPQAAVGDEAVFANGLGGGGRWGGECGDGCGAATGGGAAQWRRGAARRCLTDGTTGFPRWGASRQGLMG